MPIFASTQQTEIEHTEHDSSYTDIVVPNQNSTSAANGNNSHGKFCIIFTYSGYMLTHWQ